MFTVALGVVWHPHMQALMHAGLCNAGARAANLHAKECLVIGRKLTARLSYRRQVSCEHMQHSGWRRQLSEVSLARSCEQAALVRRTWSMRTSSFKLSLRPSNIAYNSVSIRRRELGAAPAAKVFKISVAIAERP